MANIISDKMVKAFERFNADLKTFGDETGEIFVTLYEDINTTRCVANFRLFKNGKLKWVETELSYNSLSRSYEYTSKEEVEIMRDDDEAKEYLSFWRANLRRAKKYWKTDSETLDKIYEGEIEDIEE